MAEPNAFNSLERQFVELAAKRYRRKFYQWGHLLGWLALPIFGLMFLPGLEPYLTWLGIAAILLMYEWYHVVTTRIIGKLHARAAIESATD